MKQFTSYNVILIVKLVSGHVCYFSAPQGFSPQTLSDPLDAEYDTVRIYWFK